jgi:hypothetical protein
MDVNKELQILLSKKVAPALKVEGFSRRGTTFFLMKYENYGIINFQKSTTSTKERILFTINLGVASRKIYDIFDFKAEELKPSLLNCQWWTRLAPPWNGERWWTIQFITSIDLLERDLLSQIIDIGIPEIKLYLQDDALRDLWLSGKSPSLTNFQRLLYLLAFLKDLGPHDKINETIKELIDVSNNKPTSARGYFYIKKLFPEYSYNS